MNPFDFIKSLSQTKEYQEDLTGYNQYLTNTAFSLDSDTILLANEMNIKPGIPDRLHYDFLYHTVRKKARYNKWPKKVDDENLAYVQEFYKYGVREAKMALKILTPDQLEIIKKKLNKE